MSIIPIINLGGSGKVDKRKYLIKDGNLLVTITNVSSFIGETVDGYYRYRDTSSSLNALAKTAINFDFSGGKKLYVEGYAPNRLTSSVGTNASGSITNTDNVTNRTNLTTDLGVTIITPSTDNEYVYLISLTNNYYTYIKNMWIE